MPKGFNKNLRHYRKKNGTSQLAFSEKIGISPNYLNAVENGKNFPSPELIQTISDTLDIPPYQLFLEHPVEIEAGKKQKSASGSGINRNQAKIDQ